MRQGLAAACLLLAAMPATARAQGLELAIEDRLESLVGIAAIDGRYVVDWLDPPPAAGVVLELRYQPTSRTLDGRVSDGESSRAIRGRIRLLAEIPTLTRTIERGELIGDADLTAMEVDLLDLRPGVLRTEETVEGRLARRSLPPGRPILARDVKAVPAVERKAVVTLVAVTGLVRVEAKAKALEEGALGQTVRVQNLDSRKIVTGVVVDRGVVEAISAAARPAAPASLATLPREG
jgi:flagella basal body P-ring formation protein FlgA